MTVKEVAVPGPIALIYSNRFVTDIENRLTPFLLEIEGLAREGALPITLEPAQKDWRIAVHAARYVAWLYPTQNRDAYVLGHAGRRQFRDEDRLLKATLLLRCPAGFRPFPDLRSFNDAVRAGLLPQPTTYAEFLWHQWLSLASPMSQPQHSTPSRHDRYLDLLEMVIEASRQIEADKQDGIAPQHYVSRSAARELRYSARGTYRFRMVEPDTLATSMLVCLGDQPTVRGRVTRVEGDEVVVRFEPGADFNRIPNQGTLTVLRSDRVFRAQRDAIAQLRGRKTLNPRLIDVLVSAEFLGYQPAVQIRPERRLDPDQLNAFQRALAVPDVLCVLGPPGAGKTTTIIEVVKSSVALGRRVLITSHTHRAVDNVLESLPQDLNVVRIGNEDNMSSKVKVLSAESRVETVRREILADTALLDALTEVLRQGPVLERYLERQRSLLDRARSAQARLDQLGPAIAEAVQRAGATLAPQLAHADQAVSAHRSLVHARESRLSRIDRQIRTAQAAVDRGSPFAPIYRWFITWRRRQSDELLRSLAPARAELDQAEGRLAGLRHQAEQLAGHDPRVAMLTAERDGVQWDLAGAWPELARTGQLLYATFQPIVAMPPLPEPTVAGWTGFQQRCEAALPLVEQRVTVLGQWRERISDLSVELEREIARYAQVVGATCIGTDTSALISGLDFDLAIVDEAGQISTPDLLVPLVRSHRAMLVGDHKQLPPFLDQEVRRWATDLSVDVDLTRQEKEQVTGFLARSGFELLFPNAPAPNAVWLRTQRRMPAEIATFVSDRFYFGRLRTEHPGAAANSLFTAAFAMVDTSDRPPAQRSDTSMADRTPGRHGFCNLLEAEIIVSLVRELAPQYQDWAVIVPFNAQKELIIERLTALMSASSRVAENVGSVDSFQGGERDLIIFGFTRSNQRGEIGFLRELRRFNVAITRAKRQLVLAELCRYAEQNGDQRRLNRLSALAVADQDEH